jgi:hypothetical protein
MTFVACLGKFCGSWMDYRHDELWREAGGVG